MGTVENLMHVELEDDLISDRNILVTEDPTRPYYRP
jgi:hypothetical protein